MRLYTGTRVERLEKVLERATNLKSLEPVVDCYEDDAVGAGQDLNQVIAVRAESPEELFVTTQGWVGFILDMGMNCRLECLPDMRHLCILCIETNLLVYNKGLMAELEPHAILPPCLRDLRLRECWYHFAEDPDDTTLENYKDLLLLQFQALASARHEKFLDLQKVQFWSSDWELEESEDDCHWTKSLAFDSIKEASAILGAANIQFVSQPDIDAEYEKFILHSGNDKYWNCYRDTSEYGTSESNMEY